MKTLVLIGLALLAPIAGCSGPNPVQTTLTPQERQDLEDALARLDEAIAKNTPHLRDKLGTPASQSDIAELRNYLGVKNELLETWFLWRNGERELAADLLPLGRLISISKAIDDRKSVNELPFVDDLQRRAFKILEDPAGDGFYIDVTCDNPKVFYHMLEDPFPRYFGNLPQFVEFLIRIHSAGITSLDEHGMILFDIEEYMRIEGEYLRSVGSP